MMVKNPWTGTYGDVVLTDELLEQVANLLDDDLLYELEGLDIEKWFIRLNEIVGDDKFGSLVLGG